MANILEFANGQKWILTELGYLLRLGFLGALGYFCDALQVKMGTIFISRTSGPDIGNTVSALFIGQSVICCTSYIVLQGLAAGMSTLCSQAYGAANYKLVGTYFMRALIIASLTCFPIWTIWISAKPLIYYITGDSELAQGTSDYTTVLCFSYPAYIYSKLACVFLQSQNIVFPNLAILVSGNLLNVCLQFVFVVVIPLEIKGVALAYVISTYLIAILTFIYIRFTDAHLTFSLFSWSYLSSWFHFLEYGIPGTLQGLLGVSASRIVPIIFIGFVLRNNDQVALLGILNVVWFIFSTAGLGFAIGANIRVGNILGENNCTRAKRAAVIFICAMSVTEIFLGIILVSFSHYISFIFTSDQELRQQIEFGLKILGAVVVTDVFFVARGICNACCLQLKEFIGQLFIMMAATSLGCVLAYYVTWQAAGYYIFLALGYTITFCYCSLLLCISNWDKIAERVSQNTSDKSLHNNLSETTDQQERPDFSNCEKTALAIRYAVLLIIGTLTFVVVITVGS